MRGGSNKNQTKLLGIANGLPFSIPTKSKDAVDAVDAAALKVVNLIIDDASTSIAEVAAAAKEAAVFKLRIMNTIENFRTRNLLNFYYDVYINTTEEKTAISSRIDTPVIHQINNNTESITEEENSQYLEIAHYNDVLNTLKAYTYEFIKKELDATGNTLQKIKDIKSIKSKAIIKLNTLDESIKYNLRKFYSELYSKFNKFIS
jgi:hypothetical protein